MDIEKEAIIIICFDMKLFIVGCFMATVFY